MTDDQLSPTLATHLGRVAVAAQDLAPALRVQVENAIEVAMRDGGEEGVCALLDVLLAEAVRC
jgi:hypothetical protein